MPPTWWVGVGSPGSRASRASLVWASVRLSCFSDSSCGGSRQGVRWSARALRGTVQTRRQGRRATRTKSMQTDQAWGPHGLRGPGPAEKQHTGLTAPRFSRGNRREGG